MTVDATGTLRIAIEGADPSICDSFEDVTAVSTAESADIAVAVGESALLSLASQETPTLPVDAGTGFRSVSRDDLDSAFTALVADEYTEWTIPQLRVDIAGEKAATALMDVMLVTQAPAEISEFSVETERDSIAQFRADGVLVASAPGTGGYARRVDAPVVKPELPAAAVVPIAPFATTLDHWLVSTADEPVVTMTVEREEAVVSLLADDQTVGPVPAYTPISVSATDTVSLLRVPASQSCFQTPRREPREQD